GTAGARWPWWPGPGGPRPGPGRPRRNAGCDAAASAHCKGARWPDFGCTIRIDRRRRSAYIDGMLMTATTRRAEDAEAVAEAARWRAVLDRDRREDGRFVFAVHTTGVYCRPSCPARRPRRDNVAFFDL